MYAPVVLRFRHYGATGLTAHSQAYMQQWLQDAQMQRMDRRRGDRSNGPPTPYGLLRKPYRTTQH